MYSIVLWRKQVTCINAKLHVRVTVVIHLLKAFLRGYLGRAKLDYEMRLGVFKELLWIIASFLKNKQNILKAIYGDEIETYFGKAKLCKGNIFIALRNILIYILLSFFYQESWVSLCLSLHLCFSVSLCVCVSLSPSHTHTVCKQGVRLNLFQSFRVVHEIQCWNTHI